MPKTPVHCRVRYRLVTNARSVALVAVLLVALHPAQVSGQTEPAKTGETTRLSVARMAYEHALTLKMIADQSFLIGDRTEAAAFYTRASLQAEVVGENESDLPGALVAALRSDIAYRRALVENGFEFWGSAFTRTPSVPVDHFMRLLDLLEELETLAHEVGSLNSEGEKAGDAAHAASIGNLRERTERNVRELEKAQTLLRSDHAENQIRQVGTRFDGLRARQREIERTAQSLNRKMDQIEAQTQALLVDSISTAAGLPPELMKVAEAARAGQPLDQVILQAGLRTLADPNSGLSKSLEGLSEATRTVVGLYRESAEVAKAIQGDVKILQQAASRIREGSLKSILEAGTLVYSRIPEPDRVAIENVVRATGPVVALRELATQAGPAREALLTWMARAASATDALEAAVAAGTTPLRETLKEWQAATLSRLTSVSGSISIKTLDIVVAVRPQLLLDRVPPKARRALTVAVGLPNEDGLADYLRAKGLGSLPGVTVSDGLIRVSGLGEPVEVNGRILVEQVVAQAQAGLGVAEEGARGLVAALRRTEAEIKIAAFDGLPAELMTIVARRIPELGTASSPSLFESIATGVSAETGGPLGLARQIAEFQVGAAATAGLPLQRITPEFPYSLDRIGPNANERHAARDITEQIFTAGFPALGPGGVAASIALKVLGGIEAMSAKIDEMTRLYNEEGELLREIAHLDDLQTEARFAQHMSTLERETAQARISGASELIRAYVQREESATQGKADAIRKALLRVPLALFVLDRLRYEYDALDRSLALWKGNPKSVRGYVRDRIVGDPNMLRLALDPDIDLFSWFRDDLSITKTDFDASLSYWRSRIALARKVCDEEHCTKEKPNFGEVLISERIGLRGLASATEWQRFQAWHRNPQGNFTLSFMLTPEIDAIQPGAIRTDYQGLRVVSARVGGQPTGSGEPTDIPGASLIHPGVGYVSYNGEFVREAFAGDRKQSLNWSEGLSASNLGLRWRARRYVEPLEGYALYTDWRLEVPPNAAALNASDLVVQFAYQPAPSSGDTGTGAIAGVLEVTSRLGPPHRMAAESLAALRVRSDPASAASKLARASGLPLPAPDRTMGDE